MAKRLTIFLLCLLMAFPLFACGDTEEQPQKATITGVISSAHVIDLTSVEILVNGEQKNDTVVEKDGRYSIELPFGEYVIAAKSGDLYCEQEVDVDTTDIILDMALTSPVFRLGKEMTVNGTTITGDDIEEDFIADSMDGTFRMPADGQLHLLPGTVTEKDFMFRVDFSAGIGSMMGIGITDGKWTLSFQCKQWGIKEVGVELSKVGKQGYDFSTGTIPNNGNNGNGYSLCMRRLGQRIELYIPNGSVYKKILSVDKDGYEICDGIAINWSHASIGVSSSDEPEVALNKVNVAHAQRLYELLGSQKELGIVFFRNSTNDNNKPKVQMTYEVLDTVAVPVNMLIDDITEFEMATVTFTPKKEKLNAFVVKETLYKGMNTVHLLKGEYDVKITIPFYDGDEYAASLAYNIPSYTPSTSELRIRITEDENKE